jgi:hypothetical protein
MMLHDAKLRQALAALLVLVLGRVSKIPEAHFRRLKLHEVKIPLGFSVGCADRLGSITD